MRPRFKKQSKQRQQKLKGLGTPLSGRMLTKMCQALNLIPNTIENKERESLNHLRDSRSRVEKVTKASNYIAAWNLHTDGGKESVNHMTLKVSSL